MPAVRAVLFDYGLVLSGPPDPDAWQSLRQVFAVSEKQFENAYWRHRHDYDRGALSGHAYWSAVASDLGSNLSEEKLAALLSDDVRLWTSPNSAMIAWAERLQHASVKTGILSNIGDAMETGILAHADWLAAFNHHTFSHRLGIAKPELAIYRHAAAGLNEAPEHILFIDDREENVEAARQVGMTAVQYVSHPLFIDAIRALRLEYLLDA